MPANGGGHAAAPPLAAVGGGRRGAGRWALRGAAFGYLALILVVPLGMVGWRAFGDGVGPVLDALDNRFFLHALWLTAIITLITVVANTIFGVAIAMVLARRRGVGGAILSALVTLPLAVSPVIVGLALVLVWGRQGWFGGALADQGIQVIFALPGMVLASIFISLPFVAREVAPLLREIGTEQQEAAATLGASPLQTFRRITLPAIRWGIAYGVVLTTARALGEYGAVAVVSGHLLGRTETLTLHVEDRFQAFDIVGAYTAALVLAFLALLAVVTMHLTRPKESRS
ncbi:MAG: sulfate/thiosulfate transport system permease protein [Miltoncostaeaceae bacterium]|nr:sulfate/thiosulfate transport system permease protein [Miltoncostaeaceae bacterium]